MTSKGFVIETYNERTDEVMFLDNAGHFTCFLTNAKVFASKQDAEQHWLTCKLSGIEVTYRYY